jgi:hypothetical protein
MTAVFSFTIRTLLSLHMVNICTLTGHVSGHCEVMLLSAHFSSGLL